VSLRRTRLFSPALSVSSAPSRWTSPPTDETKESTNKTNHPSIIERGAASPFGNGWKLWHSFRAARHCASSVTSFVSFVSRTNTASSLAGSLSLAFALTAWWSPGISAQLSPAW
jgi:hypothetical protein